MPGSLMRTPVHSCNHATSQLTSHVTNPMHSASPSSCSLLSANPQVPSLLSKHHTAAAKISRLRGEWSTARFHLPSSIMCAQSDLLMIPLHCRQCRKPASVPKVCQFSKLQVLKSIPSDFLIEIAVYLAIIITHWVNVNSSETKVMIRKSELSSSNHWSGRAYNLLCCARCTKALCWPKLTDSLSKSNWHLHKS